MNDDTIQTRIAYSSGLILFYFQSSSPSFSARTANTAKSKTISHWHLANITNKYQRTSFNSKQIAYACLNLFMVD